jgi:large subunit ribosomal protein L4
MAKRINTKKTTARRLHARKKVASTVVKETKPKKAVAAPAEATVYSMAGKEVGKIALPAELFGAAWRADLVHQVTTGMQANLRQNRAHTKDRSEVSGGGKKPWKQKGTGQARHGSSRSPIWRHGGITFGPRSDRDYSEKINKKQRTQALLSVLSRKAKDGELIFVDKFTFAAPKTAVAKTALVAIGKAAGMREKRTNAALVAMTGYTANTIKSFSNLGNVATEEIRNLNPLQLLTYKYLVIENPEEAFKTLRARVKAS